MRKLMLLALICFSSVLFAAAQNEYHKFEVSGGYSFERAKSFPGDRLEGSTTFNGTTTTGTTGTDRSHNLNGFNAAGVYNFSRYFGAKLEVSGNYGSDTNHDLPGGNYRSLNGLTVLVIPAQTSIAASQRDYKYLGGIQFKDNSKETKLKPFAQALFGVSKQTTTFTNLSQQRTNLIGGNPIKASSFSMALGGGLDVRVSKHLDIRVVQFDYNPVFIKEKTLVPLGGQVDSLITSFPGGSVVTTFQDLRIPKHTEHNFRLGFGIVFH